MRPRRGHEAEQAPPPEYDARASMGDGLIEGLETIKDPWGISRRCPAEES